MDGFELLRPAKLLLFAAARVSIQVPKPGGHATLGMPFSYQHIFIHLWLFLRLSLRPALLRVKGKVALTFSSHDTVNTGLCHLEPSGPFQLPRLHGRLRMDRL